MQSGGSMGSTGSMESLALEELAADMEKELEQELEGPQLSHSDSLAAWRRSTVDEFDPEQRAAITKSARDSAAKLAYQFWSPLKLFTFHLCRDHAFGQLGPKLVSITRAERFVSLCSAMQLANLVLTLLFPSECSAKAAHRQAVCLEDRIELHKTFIPTAASFLFSVVAVAASVPVTFFFEYLFRKAPVKMRLTDDARSSRISSWQARQFAAWFFALALHAGCVYRLMVFADGYSLDAFVGLLNAALLALLYRLLVWPVLSALMLTAIVAASRTSASVDSLLLRFPSLLPVVVLQEPTSENAEPSAGSNGSSPEKAAVQDSMADLDERSPIKANPIGFSSDCPADMEERVAVMAEADNEFCAADMEDRVTADTEAAIDVRQLV